MTLYEKIILEEVDIPQPDLIPVLVKDKVIRVIFWNVPGLLTVEKNNRIIGPIKQAFQELKEKTKEGVIKAKGSFQAIKTVDLLEIETLLAESDDEKQELTDKYLNTPHGERRGKEIFHCDNLKPFPIIAKKHNKVKKRTKFSSF